MAIRRMFSKTITNSSNFLMMPNSSQNLYFHLGMNADDDGFCEHFTVMRMTESKPDDLKILQAKGFVHVFDDRVLVILDWKENNYLRPDRYTASKYLELYKNELLKLSCPLPGIPSVIPGDIPLPDTGKDRKGKDRKGKVKKETVSEETLSAFEIFWNLYNLKVNKNKSLMEWSKINPDLYQTIYNHVRLYRETEKGKNYPFNPNNYLKDEHWNDEIIQPSKPQKESFAEIEKRLQEKYV